MKGREERETDTQKQREIESSERACLAVTECNEIDRHTETERNREF